MLEKIKIVEPPFASNLTDLIIELDCLREKRLGGTTDSEIFFQIKEVFHLLESLGSARIEGNNTTLADYIETKIASDGNLSDRLQEIANIEAVMSFVEKTLEQDGMLINKAFVCELHKRVVGELKHENDRTPGEYRKGGVTIRKSAHTPPDALHVGDYMDDLFAFINRQDASKYDLLKTALAHHRFAWIHPFNNGNGRTARLLTYAMLISQGFRVQVGRILNPTAIFCDDRNKYYDMLATADSGKDKELLDWCEYVLGGLKIEISKIDQLTDHAYLSAKVLVPAVRYCRERENITVLEKKILELAVEKRTFKSADIRQFMTGKAQSIQCARAIAKLKERNLIKAREQYIKKYQINFINSVLLRGVVSALQREGFVSPSVSG